MKQILSIAIASVITLLCILSFVQSRTTTVTDGYEIDRLFMEHLANNAKSIKASCHFNDQLKNETCTLGVDQEVNVPGFHEHLKFNATSSAQFNFTEYSATIELVVDNYRLFTTKYSLADLAKACAPIYHVLKLCVGLEDLKFSVKEDCFSANMVVDVQLLSWKLDLIKEHISYNEQRCQ